MRCDQCKHWKLLNDDWSTRWSGLGVCSAVREQWVVEDEATDGREAGWDDTPPPPNSWTGVRMAALKNARAVVVDGSSYRAELRTTGDFFCALFAIATEAQRAETPQSGSVHEGAGRNGIAQGPSQ